MRLFNSLFVMDGKSAGQRARGKYKQIWKSTLYSIVFAAGSMRSIRAYEKHFNLSSQFVMHTIVTALVICSLTEENIAWN